MSMHISLGWNLCLEVKWVLDKPFIDEFTASQFSRSLTCYTVKPTKPSRIFLALQTTDRGAVFRFLCCWHLPLPPLTDQRFTLERSLLRTIARSYFSHEIQRNAVEIVRMRGLASRTLPTDQWSHCLGPPLWLFGFGHSKALSFWPEEERTFERILVSAHSRSSSSLEHLLAQSIMAVFYCVVLM